MQPIIEVKNLSRTYESYKKEEGLTGSIRSFFHRQKILNKAVKKISFKINSGEFVGFIGPNGSGKTTTLKMLSGILHPTAGNAKILGFEPIERKKDFLIQIGLVMGQKRQLWWDLPAMESFILNKEIYEISDKQFRSTIDELGEILEIKDILKVPVRKLSLGQRMKCELVAAILHNPKVIFLDEPTIGLDVVSQQKIREFLKVYNKEKKNTVILTSHYMEDVEALCKRVIVIDKGKIIYDGDLLNLKQKYIDHKILEFTFTEKVDRNWFSQFGFIREFQPQRIVLEVENSKYKEVAKTVLDKTPIDDILINEVSAEDVIRKIFEKESRKV